MPEVKKKEELEGRGEQKGRITWGQSHPGIICGELGGAAWGQGKGNLPIRREHALHHSTAHRLGGKLPGIWHASLRLLQIAPLSLSNMSQLKS